MEKISNPFIGRTDGVVGKAQDNFDKYYINRKVIQVVKKTGEGDTDYIIEDKVIDEKILISEVVQADQDTVGPYNIINQVLKTGDESFLNIDNSGRVCDITNIPDNIHDAQNQLNKALDDYEKSPMSKKYDPLVAANLSKEQIESYINEIVKQKLDAIKKDGDK